MSDDEGMDDEMGKSEMVNRVKVTAACELCRKRRAKCSGDEPACRYCRDHSKPCVYPAGPIKRGPKKGTKYKKRQFQAPLSPNSDSSIPPQSHFSPPSRPPLTIPSPILPPSQPPPGPFLPQEIMSHLIEIFFTHINCQFFPILSKESTIKSFLLDELPSHLLYAIAASACAYSTHPSVSASASAGGDSGPVWKRGNQWAKKSRHFLTTEDNASYDSIQTYLILGHYELANGHSFRAWTDSTTAIKLCQLLNLDTNSSSKDDEGRSVVWSCWAFEVGLGCGNMRKSLVRGVSDLENLHSLTLPTTTTLYLKGRVLQETRHVDPFLLRSFLNLQRVNTYLATPATDSVPEWDPSSSYSSISLDLNSFSQTLPISLAFNHRVISGLSRGQLNMFTTMHVLHHLAHVSLNRSFIPIPNANGLKNATTDDGVSVFRLSCQSKAAVHAISLARILVASSKYSSFSLTPLAGYAAFTAATALISNARAGERSAAAQAVQFFSRYLLTGAEFFDPSKRLYNTLFALITVHQSPMELSSLSPSSPFFARYEQHGIVEPALAPPPVSHSRSGPLRDSLSPPPPSSMAVSINAEGDSDQNINAVQGYLAQLREILSQEEDGNASTTGATGGEEQLAVTSTAEPEKYSPLDSALFGGQLHSLLQSTSTPIAVNHTGDFNMFDMTAAPLHDYSALEPHPSTPSDMLDWIFADPAPDQGWDEVGLSDFLENCHWPLPASIATP